MSNTKISHSAVRMYSECGRKYLYHYKYRLRSKVTHGALLFGSALDNALNTLLKTKNLEESIKMFEKCFRYQDINGIGTYLPYAKNVVYGMKDFDEELITDEDEKKYVEFKAKYDVKSASDLKTDMANVVQLKKEQGHANLTDIEKMIYSFGNWHCLRNKGLCMLDAYNTEIIPQIKDVLAIQKHVGLTNSEGDKITGYIDLIVEWKDGKRYVLDNKTSSIEYEPDSAMRSQQLILYHHMTKEEYKINGGVGFIVMYKHLNKNRQKTCAKCNFDGSGGRHKTCSNEFDGVRCNGMWIEKIRPSARVQVILNQVSEAAEDLVIQTFDEANEGIKKGVFNPNLNACGNANFQCPYYRKCWYGKEDDLIQVESKTK